MLLRNQWRSLLSAPRLWLVVHGHSLLIVAQILDFCACSLFCCALFCYLSNFAIILMGKRERERERERELFDLLGLSSQTPRYECITENYYSHFSTKTYVVGTQKNRLDETVSEHQKHMFKLIRKYSQFYSKMFC